MSLTKDSSVYLKLYTLSKIIQYFMSIIRRTSLSISSLRSMSNPQNKEKWKHRVAYLKTLPLFTENSNSISEIKSKFYKMVGAVYNY